MNHSQLEPDFAEPYQAWKAAPGPDTNFAMLQSLEPDIRGAIQTHVGNAGPGIHGQAKLMALHALQSYNPTRGKLRNHIYTHLQGLKRLNAQQLQGVRAPERIVLDGQYLDRETDDMKAELGRDPTDLELADRTGITLKRMAKLRGYRPGIAEGATEFEGAPVLAGVKLPGHDRAELLRDMVYEDLDPYHRAIMEHSLGLHKRPVLSNQDIAAKLGRSPGAITQAKQRIQKLLDEAEDLRPFGE